LTVAAGVAAAAVMVLSVFGVVTAAALDLGSPSPAEPSSSPSVSLPPGFEGSIDRLSPKERRWMKGETWHPGCPVPMRKLRLLTVNYLDFDNETADGRVVVHRRVAKKVLGVFEAMFVAGFQMERVDATELYPPEQRPDKARNVTAAFNCRFIAGTTTWSQHAFGLAIDINPVQNPWVDDGRVVPRAGKGYVDRSLDLPGMIHRGDAVVDAFKGIGWGWGGDWQTKKDYMHFSQTGG
jgi:hypothetical protein